MVEIVFFYFVLKYFETRMEENKKGPVIMRRFLYKIAYAIGFVLFILASIVAGIVTIWVMLGG